jgi:hypothetical protein
MDVFEFCRRSSPQSVQSRARLHTESSLGLSKEANNGSCLGLGNLGDLYRVCSDRRNRSGTLVLLRPLSLRLMCRLQWRRPYSFLTSSGLHGLYQGLHIIHQGNSRSAGAKVEDTT